MKKKHAVADDPSPPDPKPDDDQPEPDDPRPEVRAAGKPGHPDIHGTFGTSLAARND